MKKDDAFPLLHSPFLLPTFPVLAACTGTVSGFGSDERPNAMILFNPACTLAPIAGWQPAGVRPGKLSVKRFGVEAEVILDCSP